MGDHRFDCEIKFDFHGKVYTFGPCWLNWGPSEVDFIDQRIVDFFRKSVDDAMGRHAESTYAALDQEWDRRERAEYERLKAKFEATRPT